MTENSGEGTFVRNISEAGNNDVTGHESSSKSVAVRLLTRTDTHNTDIHITYKDKCRHADMET